ncbi:hypothetical protein NESM_000674400 [Novymonas esmeraldas]|uniref:Uncharacterized protein n=1 Tax=Novymonas esmeraldas TaxID=1808958 RepID=A0AAW0EWI3_9TRYP
MRTAGKRVDDRAERGSAPSLVCFDASAMYTPPLSGTYRRHASQERHHHVADEAPSSTSLAAVHDPRLGRCLVWRPLEAPPLPRRFYSAGPPSAVPARAAAVGGAAVLSSAVACPATRSESPPVKRREGEPPPRGQLLRRGRDGLDGVLKNAREAQSLLHTLQDQRLRSDYRASQGRLRRELDEQREAKRMLQLAEYQAELVNIFGPSMRDVIADVFFDDGEDAVLAALRAKREASRGVRSAAALVSEDDGGRWRTPSPDAVVPERHAHKYPLPAPAMRETTASHERLALSQALNQVRGGRRCGY